MPSASGRLRAVPERRTHLPHLVVTDRATTNHYRARSTGGDPKIRPVEARSHGRARKAEVEAAFAAETDARDLLASTLFADELKALGSILHIEGWAPDHRLQLESLDSKLARKDGLPRWILLSASDPDHDGAPTAIVWVNDKFRPEFLARFEEYASELTDGGNPKHQRLIANMSRIRRAVLGDLWMSSDSPPKRGRHWWELWIRDEPDASEHLALFAAAVGVRIAAPVLHLDGRLVVRVHGTWKQLQNLPLSPVPVSEIRRPDLCDCYSDLSRREQDEYVHDLADRIVPATESDAPRVCHLDTGIAANHALLKDSIGQEDVHSVVPSESPIDRDGHGTSMAGLALYGPLDPLLASRDRVELRHRLESVKVIPDNGHHEYDSFGVVTADAVAQPETMYPQVDRVFCMPITSPGDAAPGEPTLWSASIDALAAGVAIGRSGSDLTLIGGPQPESARLFVISAGNVPQIAFAAEHLAVSENHPIQNPAQAWNAITVGAHTENVATPSDPDFAAWKPLAVAGELSPHSRTGVPVPTSWPNRPDVCMEGGNVLTDGGDGFDPHAVSSLLSTSHAHDLAIGATEATSAATAQVARIAARAHQAYPGLWPETVRALIVHSARWTPAMLTHLADASPQGERVDLLRRYGWGAADERRTIESASNAAHLVVQDQFVPYPGGSDGKRTGRYRLHRLPWPQDLLTSLGDAEIEMRVTLSYFIEPAASRRGWRRRFSYPSHGLRFKVKLPTETDSDFSARLENDLDRDERPRTPKDERWFIGPNGRDRGSLHQDHWKGPASELAEAGVLAVHPTKGWWHFNDRRDRRDLPVRYALVVSLRAADGIDLYTPIKTEIETATEIPAVGT
jgi:hypothetical protein